MSALLRRLRRRTEQVITVTTEDSWDLLLHGLKYVCIRVNGTHEVRVNGHSNDTLYGLPWDEELQEWDGRPELKLPISSITSIHIL